MSARRLPLFVVVEGLDGVGKSTVVDLLAQRLAAVPLRTPPRELAEARVSILRCYERAPLATTLFYASTLAAVSRDIAQLQAAGRAVVLDRYYLSTCVYGEVVRPMEHPADLLEQLSARLIPADVTVYLHAERDCRRRRMQERSHIGHEDGLTFDPGISDKLDAGFRACAGHRVAGRFLPVETTRMDAVHVVDHICRTLAVPAPGTQGGGAA